MTSAASHATTARAETTAAARPAPGRPGSARSCPPDHPAPGAPAPGAPAPAARQSGPLGPGIRARWRQVYRGDTGQIRALRRWLAGLLPDCAARDDVVTVAVELATNALRHTASGRGGWFAVEVTRNPGIVRVAVADQGAPSGPRMADEVDPLSESGHGLQVVRGLSDRTGAAGDERGRLVWADVPWTGAAGSADSSAG